MRFEARSEFVNRVPVASSLIRSSEGFAMRRAGVRRAERAVKKIEQRRGHRYFLTALAECSDQRLVMQSGRATGAKKVHEVPKRGLDARMCDWLRSNPIRIPLLCSCEKPFRRPASGRMVRRHSRAVCEKLEQRRGTRRCRGWNGFAILWRRRTNGPAIGYNVSLQLNSGVY